MAERDAERAAGTTRGTSRTLLTFDDTEGPGGSGGGQQARARSAGKRRGRRGWARWGGRVRRP
eukprot:679826-Pleurochrysis_carterae.AAC.2